MELLFEDMRAAGVVLARSLPNDDGDPTVAVISNLSEKAIAAWSLICRYEDFSGFQQDGSCVVNASHVPSALLPFRLSNRHPMPEHRNLLLPGSKRLFSGARLSLLENDIDFEADELPEMVWTSRRITLIVDSVFFADGEFVGANQRQLWERIMYAAQVHQQAGRIAAHHAQKPSEALTAIEEFTGTFHHKPPLIGKDRFDDKDFYDDARNSLAWHLSERRTRQTEEELVSCMAGWAETPLPYFRR